MATPERPAPYVNLDNARLEDQRIVMQDIVSHGECPFCPENIALYHKEPVLFEGDHWLITPNQWPYEFTDHHILAILKYHAIDLHGLRDGAFDELQTHLVRVTKMLDIVSGGIAMRFGDPSNTGATVDHLHAHLIVPSRNRTPDQKVRFKIS